MTFIADKTDRQENAVTRHRANAIHRHTGLGWRYTATCCCGWRDFMRDYLTREDAMAAARHHRLAERSSADGTTTSSEEPVAPAVVDAAGRTGAGTTETTKDDPDGAQTRSDGSGAQEAEG